ncbi:hypothetical protein HS7_07780 [Sulfolobales archaeon HS-7]|nr:hypothetical protein HS7_07780 [Sulfolobales archaeon HS-7]
MFKYYSTVEIRLSSGRMKFCPKCGGFMVPYKKEDKEYLRCTKCKYEMQISNKDKRDYNISENKSKNKILTTSLVSETNARENKDELEQEREEYYREVGLELLRDELEGDEETEE